MLSGCRLITQYKNDLMKNIKNKTSAVDKGKAKQKGLDVREPQLAQQLATQPTRPNKKRTGIRGSQQEEQFVTKDEFTELKLLIERQNTLIVKLGSEMREAIAKQNTTIAEQNTIIAKQGGEMKEAIAKVEGNIKELSMAMKILLWGIPLILGLATSIIAFVLVN